MSSKKKPTRITPTVVWDERPVLLQPNLSFIRTSSADTKQHGRILFTYDTDCGPFARVELLSWDTGEKVSEVLFDRSMLLECEFFADDLAARWLELVRAIRADFKARKKAEVSA
jgi:hypothetical protein